MSDSKNIINRLNTLGMKYTMGDLAVCADAIDHIKELEAEISRLKALTEWNTDMDAAPREDKTNSVELLHKLYGSVRCKYIGPWLIENPECVWMVEAGGVSFPENAFIGWRAPLPIEGG